MAKYTRARSSAPVGRDTRDARDDAEIIRLLGQLDQDLVKHLRDLIDCTCKRKPTELPQPPGGGAEPGQPAPGPDRGEGGDGEGGPEGEAGGAAGPVPGRPPPKPPDIWADLSRSALHMGRGMLPPLLRPLADPFLKEAMRGVEGRPTEGNLIGQLAEKFTGALREFGQSAFKSLFPAKPDTYGVKPEGYAPPVPEAPEAPLPTDLHEAEPVHYPGHPGGVLFPNLEVPRLAEAAYPLQEEGYGPPRPPEPDLGILLGHRQPPPVPEPEILHATAPVERFRMEGEDQPLQHVVHPPAGFTQLLAAAGKGGKDLPLLPDLGKLFASLPGAGQGGKLLGTAATPLLSALAAARAGTGAAAGAAGAVSGLAGGLPGLLGASSSGILTSGLGGAKADLPDLGPLTEALNELVRALKEKGTFNPADPARQGGRTWEPGQPRGGLGGTGLARQMMGQFGGALPKARESNAAPWLEMASMVRLIISAAAV